MSAPSEPAELSTFGTREQLASYLGLAPDEADAQRAALLLQIASDQMRAVMRQRIDFLADDVVTLDPRHDCQHVWVPELPITEISLVETLESDGSWRSTENYMWSTFGLITRALRGGRWPNHAQSVRVTYSHGYAESPRDLAGVALSVAARLWGNPRTLLSETLGGEIAQYGAPFAFTEAEADVLAQYAIGTGFGC